MDAWPLPILMVFFLVCLQAISFPPANRWADNAWPESWLNKWLQKYQRVLWVYRAEPLVYRLVLESKNWPDSYNLRHTTLIRVLPGRGHEVIPVSYQYIPSRESRYSHFYIKNIHVTYQTIISLIAWYQEEVGMKDFFKKIFHIDNRLVWNC
jgi:hypothetical protein